MRFIVIGITDHPSPCFTPDVARVIKAGRVFSGGRRHHEIVAPLLPAGAQWIDITAPLDDVFRQYKSLSAQSSAGGPAVIVFASGDPLFFGFASTIRREMPEADIVTYPALNSLQTLAHRLLMPYHDLRVVSLTGRPWPEFDRALIERSAKMGVLTDREHTPAAIARRMLDYGYKDYTMHIGEHLGHPLMEKVTTLVLEEAARRDFSHPNCLILEQRRRCDGAPATARPFGIPDREFTLLDGREKMITKMPIRLLDLQALELPSRHVLWDIGSCTGSVSIEARLLFPHLRVEAFEIRQQCDAIIRDNARRHGAPGIHVHIGDFCSVSCDTIAAPDAVFIGGHGGHLMSIMSKALSYLSPGGVMVMNSVSAPKVTANSHSLWDDACRKLGLTQEPATSIILNDHHPIEILKCRRSQ